MEHVNDPNPFPPEDGWDQMPCIHKIPLSEPCSECKAWRADDPPAGEVTHMCPPDGSNIMPCCGRTPFERIGDRMTVQPELVTCESFRPPTGFTKEEILRRVYGGGAQPSTGPTTGRMVMAEVPERQVSRETTPIFAELDVWSPSAADREQWEKNVRDYYFFRQVPDWYEWGADDATWD